MKTLQENRGATLIELIVAAFIMMIVLFAVISVVRVGSEIEVDDNHRRVARSLVSSWLEKHMNVDAYDTITVPQTIIYTDTVDARNGVPLIAVFTAVVSDSVVQINSYNVPVIIATAQINWQEFEGVSDSIVLTKWIANIQ